MLALQDFWLVFALVGFLAALMFLRALAMHLEQAVKQYDTMREAIRLRREYEESVRKRLEGEVGQDGAAKV